jgi:hypothetical protein
MLIRVPLTQGLPPRILGSETMRSNMVKLGYNAERRERKEAPRSALPHRPHRTYSPCRRARSTRPAPPPPAQGAAGGEAASGPMLGVEGVGVDGSGCLRPRNGCSPNSASFSERCRSPA